MNDAYDRGLLGLAIDTDYETNHYVYLLNTGEQHPLMADTDAPTFSRLERVQVSGSNLVSDRTVLLGSDGLVDGEPGTDCVTENFVTTWPPRTTWTAFRRRGARTRSERWSRRGMAPLRRLG